MTLMVVTMKDSSRFKEVVLAPIFFISSIS